MEKRGEPAKRPTKTLPLPPGPRRIYVRKDAGETMSSWRARDSTHVAGGTTVQLAMACDFFRVSTISYSAASWKAVHRRTFVQHPGKAFSSLGLSSLPPSPLNESGGEAGRRKRSVAQQSVRKGRSPPPKEVAKKAPFPTCKPNLHAFKGHGGITLFLRGVMCVWYVCLWSVQAYSFAET